MRLLAFVLGLLLLCLNSQVSAGPSSTFWTPCTIDIQPADKINLGINNYLAFGSSDPRSVSTTDFGPQFGAQINSQLAAEYGLDIISSPLITPFFLNAKIGYRENTLSDSAPALQIGFWGYGTKRSSTDSRQHIIYITTGKTLPGGRTRLMASYYTGNPRSLVSSNGEVESNGYMVAVDHHLGDGKWVLAVDYASGQNAIGGGGIGAYYFFTPDISVLFGPVWFNDKNLNGSTKLLLQFNVNI